MEAPVRNQKNSIILENALGFYQLLRLAEPLASVIKIVAATDLAFPVSDAFIDTSSLDSFVNIRTEVIIKQNLFNLMGHNGVLPDHYTEYLLERLALKDFALRDFLDIFNHTFAAQYYKAWARSEFFIAYEKNAALENIQDYCIDLLTALLGFSTNDLPSFLLEVLLYHSGFMIQTAKTKEGLETLLTNFFDLPISIEEFPGQWLDISGDEQSCLSSKRPFNQLGHNIMLGSRIWNIQNNVKIIIGSIDYKDFLALLPNKKKLDLIKKISQLYCGMEYNFLLVIIINYQTLPYCSLHHQREHCYQLGWNTWLKTEAYPNNDVSVIFRRTA